MARLRATLAAIHPAQRAFPWLVAALALALRRPPPRELAPPSACPNLLELLSVAAVRVEARLTVGAWFAALHTVTIALAVAAIAQLVLRATGSRAAALAVGLAVALGPAFPPTLAPPWEAAAFAAAAAAALVLTRPTRRAAATAAIVIVLALAAPVLVPPSSPSAPASWRAAVSCVQPGAADRAAAGLLETASAAASHAGPVVIALALLGAIAWWSVGRAGTLAVAVGLAATGAASAAWGRTGASLALGLALVATWWLAGGGIAELLERAGGRWWPRAGVAVLVVLTPLLQLARAHAEIRDDQPWPIGHAEATRRSADALLDQVPLDAALVEEDASTDILQRALSSRMRVAGKALPIVPRAPDQVEAAAGAGPVFVWPLGRRDLQLRGFLVQSVAPARATGSSGPAPGGLARLTGRLACREVTADWTDVSDVLGADLVTLVSPADAIRGPVTLVVGGPAAVDARASDWPARTRRGFLVGHFTAPAADPQSARGVWARRHDLPPDLAPLLEPFVASIVLFRTPRAPLALPVEIVGRPTRAAARRGQNAGGAGALVLCAATDRSHP